MERHTAYWDAVYERGGRVWGDEPTPFSRLLAEHLPSPAPGLRVLDLGCGYGRDSAFLSSTTGARVIGVDPSASAIERARQADPAGAFLAGDFEEARVLGPFHAVLAANVLHLLPPTERERLARFATDVVVPGGLVAFNALSTDDPQEYGTGEPVSCEAHSFVREGIYSHFFGEQEVRDLLGRAGLEELDVRQIEYEEPHAGGVVHLHRAWWAVGTRPR